MTKPCPAMHRCAVPVVAEAVPAIKSLESLGVPVTEDIARFPAQVMLVDLEQAERIVALKQAEHLPPLQERFPAWGETVEFWHVDDAPEALLQIEHENRGLVARLSRGQCHDR